MFPFSLPSLLTACRAKQPRSIAIPRKPDLELQ